MNIFSKKSFAKETFLLSFPFVFELFLFPCTALQPFQDQVFTLLRALWNINHKQLGTTTPQGESSICYCHTT